MSMKEKLLKTSKCLNSDFGKTGSFEKSILIFVS